MLCALRNTLDVSLPRHATTMGLNTLYPRPMAAKVATLYPKVPISRAGTKLPVHPFAAAIPAAVEGPVAHVHGVRDGCRGAPSRKRFDQHPQEQVRS